MPPFLRTHSNARLPLVCLLGSEQYTVPGVVLSLITGRCMSNSEVDNIVAAFGTTLVLASSLPPEGRYAVQSLESTLVQWSLSRVISLQEVHRLCVALTASDKVDVPHKMHAVVVDNALGDLVTRDPCDLWKAQAASLIQAIHEKGCFQVFAKPVSCPEYLKVIAEPMDLQTLQATTFDNPASFLNALSNIWKNAMTYNVDESQIFRDAKALQKFVNRQIVLCFYRLAGSLDIKSEFPMEWEPSTPTRPRKRGSSSSEPRESTGRQRQRLRGQRSTATVCVGKTNEGKKITLSAGRVEQLRKLTQVSDLASDKTVSGFRYINSKFSLTSPLRYFFQCRTSSSNHAVYTSGDFANSQSAAHFGINKIAEWIDLFDKTKAQKGTSG